MQRQNEHLRFAVMLDERVSALQGEVVLTCCLPSRLQLLHQTARYWPAPLG